MTSVAENTEVILDHYPSRISPIPRLLERLDPVVYGNVENGPLTADQLENYRNTGFLSLPTLFSEQEVARFLEELGKLRVDKAIQSADSTVIEPDSDQIRSIFAIHEHASPLAELCRNQKLVAIAKQILGSEIYIHQSRVNYKPGFRGKEFYWHSDFETWHVEDGMPAMRAISCSISLTANTPHNGPLMVIPGSHRKFLSCVGATPENHYKYSLRKQEYGVPDDVNLAKMVAAGGIIAPVGEAGMVTFFDCNIMHGSNSNISPLARSNVFIVYNSVANKPVAPFCGLKPRPQFIAERSQFNPL